KCHSFMSVPGLGGEAMSCLAINNCSCLFQALAATVDPMTLRKLFMSVPGLGGLGGEVMSQRISKSSLGSRQPLFPLYCSQLMFALSLRIIHSLDTEENHGEKMFKQDSQTNLIVTTCYMLQPRKQDLLPNTLVSTQFCFAEGLLLSSSLARVLLC
ncbi:6681_t:CDS:2, partial [Scutellospora calospora]